MTLPFRLRIGRITSFIVSVALIEILLICWTSYATTVSPQIQQLNVLCAGSLTNIIDQTASEFQSRHPNLEIFFTPYGSLECVQRLKAGTRCDLIAVSDWDVIQRELIGEVAPSTSTPYVSWYVLFARNEMVIAVPKGNPAGITSDNWHQLLQDEGSVRGWGRANPDADPCGYRTLMVFRLAEIHYGIPGLYDALVGVRSNLVMQPKEFDLMLLVEREEIDAAFTYLSLAKQFDTDVVFLPPQINLGDPTYEGLYASIQVYAMDKWRVGSSIMYAATVPNTAENKYWAVEFLKFLVSEAGKGIVEANYQIPIVPPIARGDLNSMPGDLASMCTIGG